MKPIEIDIEAVMLQMESQNADGYLDTSTGTVEFWSDLIAGGSVDSPDVFEDERYFAIPRFESRDGYALMERFMETVEDEQLQRELAIALNGRGAFRRFKDVLLGYPAQRQRWFGFNSAALRQEAIDWLDSLDLEYVEKPKATGVKS